MTKQSDTKNLIKEVFSGEVKFVIGIIVFVVGIIAPFYQVKQEIALIQKDIHIINTNHLSHLQDLSQAQKEQAQAILEMQKQIIILLNQKL